MSLFLIFTNLASSRTMHFLEFLSVSLVMVAPYINFVADVEALGISCDSLDSSQTNAIFRSLVNELFRYPGQSHMLALEHANYGGVKLPCGHERSKC